MRTWSRLWFVLLSALSLAPFRFKQFLGTTGLLHNAGHFVAFGISTIILSRSTTTARSRYFHIFLVCSLGAVLEFLQTAIYHNNFEWRDLFIDYAGVVVFPPLARCTALWMRAPLALKWKIRLKECFSRLLPSSARP